MSPSIKIYCSIKRGKKWWRVRDHRDGRGKTYDKQFPTLKAAQFWKEKIETGIKNGSTFILRRSSWQCHLADRFLDLCDKFSRKPEQLLLDLEEQFAAKARNRLPAVPLVAEVVGEFLAAKRRQQLSHYHLRDLKKHLERFASSFKLPINRAGRAEIEQWLNALKVGARTWNNYRAAICSLFKYAKERKYLAGDWNELAGLSAIKLRRRKIRIFTPGNMNDLLSAASERILPALAISAFAGLRTEEVLRLQWSDFKWDKGYIFLREEITKTNRTRAVPISENLADWLKPFNELSTGRVCDYANLSIGKCNLARRLGLTWSRNVLRDSFISYRLAQTQDLAKVALEAGNSPSVIHRHYLELAVPKEAEKWFAIRPATVPQNLLPLKFG